MSDSANYTAQLREAVTARGAQLNQTVTSEMKENWRSYHMNLEAVYSLLLKKGLLREDPYKRIITSPKSLRRKTCRCRNRTRKTR
jgi:hypothetical protein